MAGRLNKQVLLFTDEYGTAGAGDLYLGAVVVLARDAGRLDKCLGDLLDPGAGEIHASRLDDGYLQGLMQRFWAAAPRDRGAGEPEGRGARGPCPGALRCSRRRDGQGRAGPVQARRARP